jgi:hypothetical protein
MSYRSMVDRAYRLLQEARKNQKGPEFVSRNPPKDIEPSLWDKAVSTACRLETGKTVSFL